MQKLLISIAFLAIFTTGCSVHKPTIQQGNVIEQEMLDKLEPGMTRRQVRFVMGTPSIEDPFRTDRWDYFYSIKMSDEPLKTKHITLFFKDDVLSRIVEQAKTTAE